MQVRASFALFCAFALVHGQETENSLVISTNHGKIKGATRESRDGRMYYSFRGIPYGSVAERFSNPSLPTNWDDVKDATQPPPSCVRWSYFKKEVVGQEDCLTLNVYTPRLPMEGQDMTLLPVVVYLHPGVHKKGSPEAFNEKYFMDEDVVLVIPNYRLHVFGFLNSGDKEATGNMGLRDQAQALKWVQDNIENFGGDKARVTVLGSGSGGADAILHTLSPVSKGLIHSVISMGGSPLSRLTLVLNPVKEANKLAVQVGCPAEPSDVLVKCLKDMDGKEILEKALKFNKTELNVEKVAWFGPTVDKLQEGQTETDLIVPDNPFQLLKKGKIINKVPAIFGINDREGVQSYTAHFLKVNSLFEKLDKNFKELVPELFFYKDSATDKDTVTAKIREFYFGDKPISRAKFFNFTDFFMDRFLLFGLVAQANLYSKEAPVFLYYFKHQPETSAVSFYGVDEKLGMTHLDDVQYIFKSNIYNIPYPEITKDSKEYELSKELVKLLASFAEKGKPTKTWGEGKEWAPIKAGEPSNWYKIGATTEYKENNTPEEFRKRYEFWAGLYKDLLAKENETPEY